MFKRTKTEKDTITNSPKPSDGVQDTFTEPPLETAGVNAGEHDDDGEASSLFDFETETFPHRDFEDQNFPPLDSEDPRCASEPYDDALAGPDALDNLEPLIDPDETVEPDRAAGAYEILEPTEALADTLPSREVVSSPAGKNGKKKKNRGGHAAQAELPLHQKKSRRMRRLLIVVVALLVILMGALAYLTFMLMQETQNAAIQQVTQDVEAVGKEDAKDASTATTKKTTVPVLMGVFGKTQDEAVKAIGHGAIASTSTAINEEDNPVKTKVAVALTDEPADTRSGTPTVYLGLNEGGQVVQAGYSAATASLGYGSLSFIDAVQTEHVIEKTLNEAGLPIPVGSVALPADKTTYASYATDGTTLVKENCPFSGTAEVNGAKYTWSSVLTYDYTAANASGNLADTIRQIYIYINAA
ncbi:MAG: histone-lysine N-methyltransferase [Raoultibacter sp.]